MFTSSISNTIRCHSVGVSCNFFGHCWFLDILTDVIVNCWLLCLKGWQMLMPTCLLWQMFWPLLFMSDGIDMRPDVMALIFCDWCCCHLCICLVTDVVVTFEVEFCLTDVIANVEHFNCCKVTYHGWCYCHWVLLGWCYCLCIVLRLMLLPFCGWCCCLVADVIAKWLMLNPPMGVWQMLWPLGQCFNFNSDVVFKTSSHILGRWYLPIFLFRDGSLTLMNRASFIALVKLWSSLPTMLKLVMLMLWPVLLWWSKMGEGDFWCSLNLSAKFLADSPIYSSLHPCSLHLYL